MTRFDYLERELLSLSVAMSNAESSQDHDRADKIGAQMDKIEDELDRMSDSIYVFVSPYDGEPEGTTGAEAFDYAGDR